MYKTELIQRIGGVEMPASGRWPVIRGQELPVERRRRLHTERSTLRTTTGDLTIGQQLIGSSFELALSAPEAGEPATYHYRGHVTEVACWGTWRLTGSWRVNDAATTATLLVSYRGVYVHGAAPVAWLRITARFGFPGTVHRGRHQSVSLAGDLNVLAPQPI